MVVLGIWPYQHVLTLRLIASQGRAVPIYFVDEDRIIPLTEAQGLANQGFILDETYSTLMSPRMDTLVAPYREQTFPPPMPASIRTLLQSHEASYPKDSKGQSILKNIEEIAEHAPVAIVGDQTSDLMKDLGAAYAPNLGLWLLDAIHLKELRDKRREKYDGKVHMKQHPGGSLVEIYGDVTPHIQRLKDARGIYDEERDVWLIPMSTINQIYDILS